jgi:subtilisin family serine protease
MKKLQFKKILSVVLALALLASLGSFTAMAKGENLTGSRGELAALTAIDATTHAEKQFSVSEERLAQIQTRLIMSGEPVVSLADAYANIGRTADEAVYVEEFVEAYKTPLGLLGFEAKELKSAAPVSVIVQFTALPVVIRKVYNSVHNIKNNNLYGDAAATLSTFKSAAKSVARGIEFGYDYNEVFSGVAVTVPANKLEALAALPGVYSISPDYEFTADYTADPTYSFTGLAESREAFNIADIHAAGITGAGVTVGVLDTGIDYNHPDLASVYKGGWDWVGKDNSPMETTYAEWQASGQPELSAGGSEYYTSHGTHVSGTIAATASNGAGGYKTLGLAPAVDLYVARVLGPYGSGSGADILAAINDFAADGGNLPKVDVINLSLGHDTNTAYDAENVALNNATLAGVNAAISAGNNADSGTARKSYTLGTPGTAYLPVTVAASQFGGSAFRTYDAASANGVNAPSTFGLLIEGQDVNNLFSDDTIGGAGANPALIYVPGKGYELYLAFGAGDTNPTLAQLQAIPAGSLNGKILVVKRGLNFVDFLEQAIRAGAGGLIIVNNATNGENYITNMAISGIGVNKIPIFSAYHSTSAKLTATAGSTAIGAVAYLQPGALSSVPQLKEPAYFSSIGPVKETLGLKPDIIAPGWSIVSTAPAYITTANHNSTDYSAAYQSMSGTSMSAPHIAGILALMKQKYPSASAAEIKARLMNTSKPDFIAPNSAYSGDHAGTQGSVLEVGAGFVDPYRALILDTETYVTVADGVPGASAASPLVTQTLASLSFGAVPKGSTSRLIPVTIHNEGAAAKTYTISSRFNNNTRYSGNAATAGLTVVLGATTKTVAPGGTETFDVSVAVPSAADGFYEGYVVVTETGKDYDVPFLLYAGEPVNTDYVDDFFFNKAVTSTNTATRQNAYSTTSDLWVRFIQNYDCYLDVVIYGEDGYLAGILNESDPYGNASAPNYVRIPDFNDGYYIPYDRETGTFGEDLVPIPAGFYWLGLYYFDYTTITQLQYLELGQIYVDNDAPVITLDEIDIAGKTISGHIYDAGTIDATAKGIGNYLFTPPLVPDEFYEVLATVVSGSTTYFTDTLLLGGEENGDFVLDLSRLYNNTTLASGNVSITADTQVTLYAIDHFDIRRTTTASAGFNVDGYSFKLGDEPGLILNPSAATLLAGRTVKLTAEASAIGTLFGVDIDLDEISFASSDTAVATVSASGLVTGVAPGTAIVTATAGDLSATAAVTVLSNPYVATNVSEGVNIPVGSGIYYGAFNHATSLASGYWGTPAYAGAATPILWQYVGSDTTATGVEPAYTLLSKYAIDARQFNTSSSAANKLFVNSPLKTWLNNDFLNSLNASEQTNIPFTDVVTYPYSAAGAKNNTESVAPGLKVYLPWYIPGGTSVGVYWSADGNYVSAANKLQGSILTTLKGDTYNPYTWTRTPNSSGNTVFAISPSGSNYADTVSELDAVRPVTKLIPEHIVYAYPVVAGGAVGTVAPDANYVAGNYKLTVLGGTNYGTVSVGAVAATPGKLTVTGITGTAGTGNLIAYKLVSPDGEIVAYGEVPATATSLEINTSDLEAGGGYLLAIWKQKNNALTSNEAGPVLKLQNVTVQAAVDKSALEEAIETAEDLTEADWSEESWADLEEALEAAQEVYDDPDATQAEVDAATEALLAAIEALTVDKSALEDAIEEGEALLPHEDEYVAGPWDDFIEALEAAQEVYDDPDATQSEVDAATQALLDAIAALETERKGEILILETPDKVTIKKGRTVKVPVIFNGNATYLTYSSANTAVATVTGNGTLEAVIVGVKVGNAPITVRANDGSGLVKVFLAIISA